MQTSSSTHNSQTHSCRFYRKHLKILTIHCIGAAIFWHYFCGVLTDYSRVPMSTYIATARTTQTRYLHTNTRCSKIL